MDTVHGNANGIGANMMNETAPDFHGTMITLKCSLFVTILTLAGSCVTVVNSNSVIGNTSSINVNKTENDHFFVTLTDKHSPDKIRDKDGIIYYIVSGDGQNIAAHGENIAEKYKSKLLDKGRTWNVYYKHNMYCSGVTAENPDKTGGLYVGILVNENSMEELKALINASSTPKI
ncbi:MAG: hypothetical protein LBH60_00275 [Prevotellaceae bacterium]|jgi:hypothetical protein|nr:hypothetical protein [Prevotellaceae bacterium]